MNVIRQIFDTLQKFYADKPPMAWWSEDPMEVIIGAVLVTGTTWKSVAAVLQTLKEKELLNFRILADINEEQLIEVIRSVGFQVQKAQRLKSISQLFLMRTNGDIARFFARDPQEIRRELLSISGIGPGTADNIMLYAGNFPVYMLDDYTVRILQRHGYIALNSKKNDIQRFIQQELRCSGGTSQEVRHFSNFQALMVRTGREYCAKTKPKCGLCPLFSFLPEKETAALSENLHPPLAVSSENLRPPIVEKPREEKQDSVNSAMPELDGTERKIVEQITAEPVPIDDVIEKTGLPVHIVRATIAILESRRIVRQTAGNTVKRIV